MFETERLRIRLFRDSDLDRLDEIHSDPVSMRYMGLVRTRDETREKIRAYIDDFPKNGFTMWALESKDDGDLVGRAGLSFLDGTEEIEVGYLIDRKLWGRGLATEAARACVHFGFEEVGLEWIVGIVQPPNKASLRVLRKLGFVYLRDDHYYNADVLYHRLERSRWRSRSRHRRGVLDE